MGKSKKYEQLYDNLADEIRRGVYRQGDRLPNENDIAKSHNLSRQTVRQALSMLEEKQLIRKVQGSGSYVSGSDKGRSKAMRIAVITTYINTYIFPSILRGIEEIAAGKQYSLQLYATNNSLSKEREVLDLLSRDTVDGIIVEGTKTALPNPNLTFYKAFAEKNIPLVFFDGYYPELLSTLPGGQALYVITDDHRGGFLMTKDLITKGHRKIGGIFKSDDQQGLRRFSGYMDALAAGKLPLRDDLVMWFSTETKNTLKQYLLSSPLLKECSAIICYNDEIACQLLELCSKEPPPSLTALRSFDGVLKLAPAALDFQSCRHPMEQLGRLAAEKLFACIEGKQEESRVLMWE